ncbi:plasmid replication protein RepC [Paracoccus benzoatiresistens]|uniref:Plasmid replication protein RepC n=1 Tax=Paracoccus benzoatiresistens TaxID=2997341 RepID=A0ABT4JAJ6_9RHOB|nr:plasmid replication protein RepC [Paracoccus sp. EF6]MCZ0964093.1 plasmid replication protein RepC [Paracoccus sp. EF6]
MTFHRAITPGFPRTNSVDVPIQASGCLKEAYRHLSAVAKTVGLSTGVLHTLRAMIHCVRPEKSLTCFASTETLIRLRSGGSERSIRRHVEQLITAGIIVRNDSPNKKRYMVRDASSGEVELFGFDLSPMLRRLAEWKCLDEKLAADISRKRYLRTVILGRLHRLDQLGSAFDTASTRSILRRNLAIEELEVMLSTVADHLDNLVEAPCPTIQAFGDLARPDQAAKELTGSGGQIDRHQHRSETYIPESEDPSKVELQLSTRADTTLLRKVEATCSEAIAFAQGPLQNWDDVHALAWLLAPMIGIDKELLAKATRMHGSSPASVLVLLLLQQGNMIRNTGGYFRALTMGPRATSFDPWGMLDLMEQKGPGAPRCFA